jgi:hypothetical protein
MNVNCSLKRVYSSGPVQDLHLIPFSLLIRRCGLVTPIIEYKVGIKNWNNNILRKYFFL